jgi:hypothetical protein
MRIAVIGSGDIGVDGALDADLVRALAFDGGLGDDVAFRVLRGA